MPEFIASWERMTGKKLYPKDEPFNTAWPFAQISIRFIPQGCMRGAHRDDIDYWVDEHGVLQIRIAQFENPDFAFYRAIHGLLEAWRCARGGVSLAAIEVFDAKHKDHDGLGYIPDARHHEHHMQSLTVQRIICEQDRYSYDDYLEAEPLSNKKD